MAPSYQFEIINKSWVKRRRAGAEPQPVAVQIADFQKVKQHMCHMQVTYDDGSTQEYLARVLQNHITGVWTVDGMHVAVRVVESD